MILREQLKTNVTTATRHIRATASLLSFALIHSMACLGPAIGQSGDEGRAIYERRCSVCHGDQGSGAFWVHDSLDPPPRDFTQTAADELSREAMIDAVAHGRKGTAMTAWASRLSSTQIAAVVDFIRTEFMSRRLDAVVEKEQSSHFPGGLVGDADKGGVFFHANCADCHGHAGDGRGRRAKFMVRKPLEFTAQTTRRTYDRARLYRSISDGVRGSTMPAWSKVLNGQQIADVAEYVYRAFVKGKQLAIARGTQSKAATDAGKGIFLQRCAYCHGHKGDGRTAAAQVLDPKPRDFTRLPRIGADEAAAVIREGRKGTAMPSFAIILSDAEIRTVANYVTQSIVGRNGEDGRYHTPANGWPDHEVRYGAAIPFALGQLAVDAPLSTLSSAQLSGLVLFKGACVSCHFGRRDGREMLRLAYFGKSPADYGKVAHDKAPEVENLTPAELEGRRLYQAACAQCHAADGTGKNWIGRFLQPSPADFNSAQFQSVLSSDSFVERTLRAPDGTSMPSFEDVLSQEQAEAIAAYARRVFGPP